MKKFLWGSLDILILAAGFSGPGRPVRRMPQEDDPEHRRRLAAQQAQARTTSTARPATATEHNSRHDVAKAEIPTPETCAACHDERVDQFKKGKHAFAWAAMKAMPTAHAQPVALMEGMKGCGGCHKIGLKTEAEIKELRKDGPGFRARVLRRLPHPAHVFGQGSAQPQACQTCHMGFDHPQWEMYSASKHGVRSLLKQNKTSCPRRRPAPTCQTCHMQDGDHEVMTAWGFLAVRLPMPEDKAVGRRPGHDPAGLGRSRSGGQADRAARGRQGRRALPG